MSGRESVDKETVGREGSGIEERKECMGEYCGWKDKEYALLDLHMYWCWIHSLSPVLLEWNSTPGFGMLSHPHSPARQFFVGLIR